MGINASRNYLQRETLLECLEVNKIDAAMGGARRDEEKSRAKERFFPIVILWTMGSKESTSRTLEFI